MKRSTIKNVSKFRVFPLCHINLITNGLGSVLGSISEVFGELLGASWAVLGASWVVFGRLLGALGRTWVPLGSFGRLLNDFWPSGKVSGTVWEREGSGTTIPAF